MRPTLFELSSRLAAELERFFHIRVAEFGLDSRVVVRSVTEEGSAKWAGKILPNYLSLSGLTRCNREREIGRFVLNLHFSN